MYNAVIDHTREFLKSSVSSPEQRGLLLPLIDHFSSGEPSPYLEIPLLVYGGITGNAEGALPLGSLGAFLFLGMDIIDDIADGDAKAHWPKFDPLELELAASLFLSALPQILISNLNAPSRTVIEIQKRFARGIIEAARGQQKELKIKGGENISQKEIEDSVAGKSSGLATLACISAELAGAEREQIGYYEEMGGNLGGAAQLATDFHDLFESPVSRDLKNEIRTLPIALYLEKCPAIERKNFLNLLRGAGKDPAKEKKVRSLLFSKGIARLTAFIVELYCERARKGLLSAKPKEPYGGRLAEYINKVSFFV